MLPHVSVSLKPMGIWAAVVLLALSKHGESAGSKLTRLQKKKVNLYLILLNEPGQFPSVAAGAL